MNLAEQQLYQNIKDYALDHAADSYTFSKRLAYENGWSRAYTERTIAEYKKFAFLAMVAGHVVTPSDQVDQVWHMHLTYTHSYWEEFCENVLGRALHHEPTRGGKTENHKYRELYKQTLASYERYFNCKPPVDIWPSCDDRFGRDLYFVRVNTKASWVISKPQFKWPPKWIPESKNMLKISTLFLFIELAISGCNAQLDLLSNNFTLINLFDFLTFSELTGSQYLALYLISGICLCVFAQQIKSAWQNANLLTSDVDSISLNLEELAYLSGTQIRLIDTVVVKLLNEGYLILDDDKKLAVQNPISADASDMEQAVFENICYQTKEIEVLRAELYQYYAIEEGLKQRGLIANDVYRHINTKVYNQKIMILFLPLLLLGFMRLIHGNILGHPVGYLILLLLTLAAAIQFRIDLKYAQRRTF